MSKIQEQINKALGYKTLAKPPKWWLDTGYRRLNGVFGSKELGLSSGKIYLLAGKETSGKSVLAAFLAGIGQNKYHALVGWVDGEESWDDAHVRRQRLHPSKVELFYPLYGTFGASKKKKGKAKKKAMKLEEVEPAENLFERVEIWMKLMRRKHKNKCRLILVVDSTNAFSPREEQDAGFTDQNMRTRTSPAVFLNTLTKRLGPLAVHTNAIVILISQLRTNPSKMFGNPDYIPGGGGMKYFPSSIVWMRRVKDGEIKQSGVQVGVKGLISNTKNKVGGGSKERRKAGYMAYFFKPKWKFTSADEIKGDL